MVDTKPSRPRRGRPRPEAGPRRRSHPTQARLVAVRVLERVERAGAYADLALHAALRQGDLGPRDRALITELVYGTLRWRGRLDYLLGHVLDRDFAKLEPLVATLLRVGAYQILFSDRIPDRSAVDQTVRCAHAAGAERAAGLVNAVLRRLCVEQGRIDLPGLDDDPLGHLTHALSLPPWLAERLLDLHGPREAAALAEALTAVPPLTARVNPLRSERDALWEELRERLPDAELCRFAPQGIRLGHRGNPGHDPAFLDGRFTVQDEASQLVVEWLDPKPGERILDLCAAPGTKTTHIAEKLAGTGEVVAADRSAGRLALVGRACRRLGLSNVTTRELDGTLPWPETETAGFDRVLVDAPCSGIGTLRRNPDARWRIRPEDPARLAETQAALLRSAGRVLRPGGVLVYSTCTLLPEENEAVVTAFLGEVGELRLAPSPAPDCLTELISEDGFMRTLPHRHDTDGFFAARMEKQT